MDEAGRGPLCGPVVAAAVILPAFRALPPSLSNIDDSKRLTAAQRDTLAVAIRAEALAYGIGACAVVEIDRLNIRRASLLAMLRAVEALRAPSVASLATGVRSATGRENAADCPAAPGGMPATGLAGVNRSPAVPDAGIVPGFVLVDGRDLPPGLPCPARAVVKGDQLSASIAAAAILAKTHRDGIMAELARRYPGYGWEHNAGYPTQAHLTALERLGVTPEHRRGYGPVARLLGLC
ncbi:MAG: ribonuclease HII [Magnetococcales bacterium]|nr:ribonuclease HII [Magnetococcales bacterium]